MVFFILFIFWETCGDFYWVYVIFFYEVKKIITPRPKEITQWANLMTSNHKRNEFTTKKKDGMPKSFEAQKSTEGKGLSLPGSGNRGESSRKSWARIPRGCQRLEIPGMHSTAEVGWRQLGRDTMKYKKRRTYMSFSSTQCCSKEPESLENNNSWTTG